MKNVTKQGFCEIVVLNTIRLIFKNTMATNISIKKTTHSHTLLVRHNVFILWFYPSLPMESLGMINFTDTLTLKTTGVFDSFSPDIDEIWMVHGSKLRIWNGFHNNMSHCWPPMTLTFDLPTKKSSRGLSFKLISHLLKCEVYTVIWFAKNWAETKCDADERGKTIWYPNIFLEGDRGGCLLDLLSINIYFKLRYVGAWTFFACCCKIELKLKRHFYENS